MDYTCEAKKDSLNKTPTLPGLGNTVAFPICFIFPHYVAIMIWVEYTQGHIQLKGY